MPQQITAASNTASTWFFVRIGRSIGSSFSRLINWYTLQNDMFPTDEAGELMQRYMERKSWFDKISSWWVDRSFLVKATFIAGFSLVAALAGLLINASLLFALSAIFVSFVAHTLFVFHERSRREGAKAFAEETIALNEDLKTSQAFFKKATSELHLATNELKTRGSEISRQAIQLEVENQALHQANEELVITVDEVSKETERLILKEKAITDCFETMADDLQKCDTAITKTTAQVEKLGETLSELSETTQEMKKSGQIFSTAVNHFSLFVDRLTQAPPVEINDEPDEFITSLRQQNDEDDALIQQMKLQMMGLG